MKLKIISLFLFFLILPSFAQARLGETEEENSIRYGTPFQNPPSSNSSALLKNSSSQIYHYKGWQIQVAFLNDHAVRIRYSKLPQKGSTQVMHKDEINTILQAEVHGGSWKNIGKKSFFTKYKKGDQIFQNAQTRFVNSNGSRAYLTPGHMNLYIDSQEAILWEQTMVDEQEIQRKENIPSF